MLRALVVSVLMLLLMPVSQGAPLMMGADVPYLYAEDPTARMTLEQFLKIPDSELSVATSARSWGYTRSAYWLKWHFPAALFKSEERWLQLGPNFLDHVTLYYRLSGDEGPWMRREAGDNAPYENRDLDYRYTVFKFPRISDGSSGYDVVVRLESSSSILLDSMLWQPAEFTEQSLKDTLFWSFYFGMALISSAIAFLLAVLSGNRLFWSVSAFSLSYLLVACIQGYLGWLLGRVGLQLQDMLTPVLVLSVFACMLWMSAEGLNLKRHMPRLYRGVNTLAVMILLSQIAIPLGRYADAVHFQALSSLFSAFVLLGSALHLRWRRHISVLEMLVGLGPLLFIAAGIIAAMMLNDLIGYSSTLYALWEYLLMGNMLLMLAVAVWRVRCEQKRSLAAQQEAREWQLERAANFHQRQFIGMVSHEFRTPLAVISAVLENLKLLSSPEDPRNPRYEKIQRATSRLMMLTDNCLADARLSSDALYLNREPVDLLLLIDEAAAVVVISDQHRLQLTVDGADVDLATGQLPEIQLSVDQGLLGIALSNLLDNAVKYSSGGVIGVAIDQQDTQCLVSISDQGPGIEPELAEQIFDRYRRASSVDQGIKGSGLGLHVARQIARAHGGDLVLAAPQRVGCRFVLSLPRDAG